MRPLLFAAVTLSPKRLLKSGGLAVLTAIIFAESGLLIGFFLPGDSLLFIAGFFSSHAGGNVLPALPIVLVCVFLAAVAGDQVGYLFGRKVGPTLFSRPDSRLFKQDHVQKAHAFLEKHGPKTIVMARFVPIVRTFAPIVAGVGHMHYRKFVAYNLVGGALWAVGVTTLGFFLGKVKFIEHNIEAGIIVIVLLSLLPMAFEFWRHRRAIRHAPVAAD